ncbi:MAG: fibronectin type III domain-containing protein, partial [Oscillospiraceae bacterium]
MEAFAGLYSADIDTVAEDKAKDIFENGITILQLNPEYKTFDIPVRNAVLVQEKESDGSNKTLTVRKDNEDWLDTEDDSFYLCYAYADEETRFFQISSSEMTTEKAVWDEIAAWVTENEDLDTSNLFLCRNVMANVCGNGTNSQFDTKDLIDYQIVNQGQSTTNKALIALYTANAKSIWRVVPFDNSNLSFYTYQSDAMKSVSDYLLEHPHESVLTLTEQGSINVTAVDPNTNEKIDKNSYIGSNLFDENGDPRTITDHLNDLLNAVPQEAGKKYDADGWQLWEAVVSCGGINNFSQIELDEKPDSIGVTELNKVKKEKVLVYFPQVEIAPSLEITAPVVGETPSFECKIVDKVGGYSVISVEWSCGNTLLGENDKFEAGKKYTVTILLSADVNLSFVNSTPVTINGEKAGTSYDENIGFYAYQSFTTAPEKPVNVKATAGDGKVTLTWDAFPNATSYRIYRANSETGAKSLLKAVTTTTYTDTTVTAGNTYYYFVAAYNSKTATLSEYSDAAKVTVPAVLVAPVISTITTDGSSVTLAWNKVTGATSYRIYRADTATGAKTLLKGVAATTYTDSTVTAGKTYYYFVAAYDSVNKKLSEYSDAAKVTVPAVLVAPVISTITTDGSSVTLAWNKVTGATSYRIYRADTATGAKTLLKAVTSATYTDTTVTAGKTYYYFVAAYDSVNKKLSDYSAAKSITVQSAFAAPSISSITTDGSSVTLAWNKVTGATSYRIYRADSATGAKTLLKAVTSATYTDTTVTAGKTYYYFVAAYDSVNKKLSDYSAAKSIKVEAAIAAPVISTITTDGSSVTLAWNKVTGATSYRIYRADTATGTKTLLKAVTSATYTDTTVTAGKTYYYFVAAYDSVNKKLSDYSAAKSIKVEA